MTEKYMIYLCDYLLSHKLFLSKRPVSICALLEGNDIEARDIRQFIRKLRMFGYENVPEFSEANRYRLNFVYEGLDYRMHPGEYNKKKLEHIQLFKDSLKGK